MAHVEETCDDVVQRDHDRDDEDGGREAVKPRAHENDEVELESEQDDAGAQELVRDEWRAPLRSVRERAHELQRHAEEQREDELADEGKARQLRERVAGERAEQRDQEADAEARDAAQGDHRCHGCSSFKEALNESVVS